MPIRLPANASPVHFEGELAVVIGRPCKDVPAAQAADNILGYTIGNDVSARDQQKADGQWTRAKGHDTFCPVGPWIVTDLDPATGTLSFLLKLKSSYSFVDALTHSSQMDEDLWRALVTSQHGPLAAVPLGQVARISAALAPQADLNAGSARTALRRAVLAAQNGDRS